jgi:hypothetical protein
MDTSHVKAEISLTTLYCVNERVKDTRNTKFPTKIWKIQLVTVVDMLNLIPVKYLRILSI